MEVLFPILAMLFSVPYMTGVLLPKQFVKQLTHQHAKISERVRESEIFEMCIEVGALGWGWVELL